MKHIRQATAYILAVLTIFGGTALAAEPESASTSADTAAVSEKASLTYSQYRQVHTDAQYGEEIILTADNAIPVKNAEKQSNINGTGKSGIAIEDNGSASWSFEVPADRLYKIAIEYIAAKQGSGDLELGFLLDGSVPFDEAEFIALPRTYSQPEGEFKKNASGNEIKPDVTEELVWNKIQLTDASGYVSESFDFYLTAGKHTITLNGSRGMAAIGSISLVPEEKVISYEEYQQKNAGAMSPDCEPVIIEGEHLSYKNSVVITPKTDRSSAVTSPQSTTVTLLNSVGGSNWKEVGDSVTWKIKVEKTGLYKITLRSRQNVVDGMYTSRRLYIDGSVPFAEAEQLRFMYDSDWQSVTLGADGEAFEFYLEAGEHTLTLEAVAGELADTVGEIKNILNDLYRIYRRIVMITGTSPDTQRDYSFESLIPDEIKELGEYAEKLQKAVDYIDNEAGKNGSYTSVMKKVIAQLEIMSSDPDKIAKYLEQFKSNLGSVSSWLLTALEQPLEIDLIEIAPADADSTVKAGAGFFKGLWFSLKSFLSSYVTDYSTIGSGSETDGKTLKAWIQTGRDQAEVIRELIDSDYSQKYDSSVVLEVVTGGLLQSVLADQAPDVVFDLVATDPMDYALRGAAYDLTQFEDYSTVAQRFSPAALTASTFEGGVYGLPQTFSFYMFFYRTDIFEEYGFTVPETWEQLIAMIPALQRNSMEVGLPHDINAYAMFLNQRGGELYRDGGAVTNLDSNLSISTFVDFTDYFSLYDLSVSYDFSNRFRSGEMPCAVADYINYNQLTAFAPEIKGRWEMVPVPGTRNEKGGIDNTSIGTATYMMILNNSDVKAEAWEFMKWFMSSEIQSMYSIKMESILGSCAKVATANVEALSQMTWSSNEYTNLFKQYENVKAVPQVPGGYYLSRIFNFAFNRVYNGSTLQNMGEDPATVLGEYIPSFNEELERKRAEFGR